MYKVNKPGKERKKTLFILWSPSDKYKGENWNLPVGRWLTTAQILLRRNQNVSTFGLKTFGCLGFAVFQKKENPHQVTSTLVKPASKTTNGNHAECSDQVTLPSTCDNSWKIKVFYRKKSMSGSFLSSTVFMCLTTFHGSKRAHVLQHPQSASNSPIQARRGRSYRSQKGWIQKKPQLSAHLSPWTSMENLILKLPKINIGIIFMTFSSD